MCGHGCGLDFVAAPVGRHAAARAAAGRVAGPGLVLRRRCRGLVRTACSPPTTWLSFFVQLDIRPSAYGAFWCTHSAPAGVPCAPMGATKAGMTPACTPRRQLAPQEQTRRPASSRPGKPPFEAAGKSLCALHSCFPRTPWWARLPASTPHTIRLDCRPLCACQPFNYNN